MCIVFFVVLNPRFGETAVLTLVLAFFSRGVSYYSGAVTVVSAVGISASGIAVVSIAATITLELGGGDVRGIVTCSLSVHPW